MMDVGKHIRQGLVCLNNAHLLIDLESMNAGDLSEFLMSELNVAYADCKELEGNQGFI